MNERFSGSKRRASSEQGNASMLRALGPALSMANSSVRRALSLVDSDRAQTSEAASTASSAVRFARDCGEEGASLVSALDKARSDNVSLAEDRDRIAEQSALGNESIASLEGDLMDKATDAPASASTSASSEDMQMYDDIDELKDNKKGYLRILIGAKALGTRNLDRIADLVQIPIGTAYHFARVLDRVTGETKLSNAGFRKLISILEDTDSDDVGNYNDELSDYVIGNERNGGGDK